MRKKDKEQMSNGGRSRFRHMMLTVTFLRYKQRNRFRYIRTGSMLFLYRSLSEGLCQDDPAVDVSAFKGFVLTGDQHQRIFTQLIGNGRETV